MSKTSKIYQYLSYHVIYLTKHCQEIISNEFIQMTKKNTQELFKNCFKSSQNILMLFLFFVILNSSYLNAETSELICNTENPIKEIYKNLDRKAIFIPIKDLKKVWGAYPLESWNKLFDTTFEDILINHITASNFEKNPELEYQIKFSLSDIKDADAELELLKYQDKGLRYSTDGYLFFKKKFFKFSKEFLRNPRLSNLSWYVQKVDEKINFKEKYLSRIANSSDELKLESSRIEDIPTDLEKNFPDEYRLLREKQRDMNKESNLECLVSTYYKQIVDDDTTLALIFSKANLRDILLSKVDLPFLIDKIKYSDFRQQDNELKEFVLYLKEKNNLEKYIAYIPPGFAVEYHKIGTLTKDEALACGSLLEIHKYAIENKIFLSDLMKKISPQSKSKFREGLNTAGNNIAGPLIIAALPSALVEDIFDSISNDTPYTPPVQPTSYKYRIRNSLEYDHLFYERNKKYLKQN